MQWIFADCYRKLHFFDIRSLNWRTASQRPSLRRLQWFGGVFLSIFAATCDSKVQAQGWPKDSTTLQPSKPDSLHPWLLEVPAHLARLVDKGKVRIEVNEAAVQAARRTAITEFSFQFQYHMRYRPVSSQKLSATDSPTKYSIRFFDTEWSFQHKISLSENYRPIKPWVSALLLHEFDHVAISTDPRLTAIIETFDDSQLIIEIQDTQDRRKLKAAIDQAVAEHVKKFQALIENLVKDKYKKLDEKSSNGLIPIGERGSFFHDLYSIETLRSEAFPYLDQVSEAIANVREASINQHYSTQ